MIDLSTQRKIRKAKKGDKDSFILLIEDNLKSMYKVSKGILSSEVDVEDCIQNTILKAFENISLLKKDDYFKTWILRILINECNKVYNTNKKFIDIEGIGEASIEESYENVDLKEAIKSLPVEMKDVIVLHYYEDMPQKEIGKILNIPEGTVKSRLSRAKGILEKILMKGEIINEQNR